MTRLYTLIGTTLGSYAGWYLGSPLGLVAAFMLGMVGTGMGFYFGRKVARHYQP
jgi:hypothetical protein